MNLSDPGRRGIAPARSAGACAPLLLGAALVLGGMRAAPASAQGDSAASAQSDSATGAPRASSGASVAIQVVAQPGASVLRRRYSEWQLGVLELLNRADLAHLGHLDAVAVPEPWPENLLAVSPLPGRLAWAAHEPKVLVVHQPTQVFGAYENGTLVRWGPVSTGRRDQPTPAGLFHLTWKSKQRTSTIDSSWLLRWYFNYEPRRGLSFHEYVLPGRPVSHQCVRLLARDAYWLYGWGEQWKIQGRRMVKPGTPVWIVGYYDFAARPPWREPDALTRKITLPPEPAGSAARGALERRDRLVAPLAHRAASHPVQCSALGLVATRHCAGESVDQPLDGIQMPPQQLLVRKRVGMMQLVQLFLARRFQKIDQQRSLILRQLGHGHASVTCGGPTEVIMHPPDRAVEPSPIAVADAGTRRESPPPT